MCWLTKADEMTSLGVFAPNRTEPIHRWYPFVEGYSKELVSRELEMVSSLPRVVFDPFAGSGTTLLVAAQAGVPSFFSEVNPYLSFVANTKVNAAREATNDSGLPRLLDLAKVLEERRPLPENPSHPLLQVDSKRNFFPPGVAATAVGVLIWIESELEGSVAALARLACASCLIPASNMIRRTDLRRRGKSDPPPANLVTDLAQQLRVVFDDVHCVGPEILASTTQVATDVRELTQAPKPFDLIVTSPPYLNGTNYSRNTKLELLALGLIESEKELTVVRTEAITAGINYVSRRREAPKRFEAVESVAEQLDNVAYDKRIPSLVRGYFSDMATALDQIRACSAGDSRFMLDIGDSKFCGVHVPTDRLLMQIAEMAGWQVQSVELLRARRSYDGSSLRQVLIEMTAA